MDSWTGKSVGSSQVFELLFIQSQSIQLDCGTRMDYCPNERKWVALLLNLPPYVCVPGEGGHDRCHDGWLFLRRGYRIDSRLCMIVILYDDVHQFLCLWFNEIMEVLSELYPCWMIERQIGNVLLCMPPDIRLLIRMFLYLMNAVEAGLWWNGQCYWRNAIWCLMTDGRGLSEGYGCKGIHRLDNSSHLILLTWCMHW